MQLRHWLWNAMRRRTSSTSRGLERSGLGEDAAELAPGPRRLGPVGPDAAEPAVEPVARVELGQRRLVEGLCGRDPCHLVLRGRGLSGRHGTAAQIPSRRRADRRHPARRRPALAETLRGRSSGVHHGSRRSDLATPPGLVDRGRASARASSRELPQERPQTSRTRGVGCIPARCTATAVRGLVTSHRAACGAELSRTRRRAVALSSSVRRGDRQPAAALARRAPREDGQGGRCG